MMSPAASSNGGSQKSFSSVASFRSVTHPNFLKRLAKKQLDLKRENFSGNQQKWNKIGEGHYADVYKTYVTPKYTTDNSKPVEAAAKILKDRHGQTEFQNEALMLAEAHGLLETCIVPVIGIYFPDKRNKPKEGDFMGFSRTMLVTEFMHNGDAEKFLKIPENVIPHPLVLKWCKQLAKAAVFMNAHGIVHRDIGARNCFLDYDMDLRLGDFGLARKSEDEKTVYNAISMGRALPLPYLSVEAFQEMVFSHKSDIWAIAITFWEFYTRCEKAPYVGEIPLAQLATDLEKGKRLKRPDLMPKSIYKLCEECWQKDPKKRPDGDELLRKTSDICDSPRSFKINVDKCYIGGNTDSIKIYETRIEMEEEKRLMNDSQHVNLLQRGLNETHREEDTPFIPINNTKTDIDYDDKSVGFFGMVRRKKWMVVVAAVIQNVDILENKYS